MNVDFRGYLWSTEISVSVSPDCVSQSFLLPDEVNKGGSLLIHSDAKACDTSCPGSKVV